MIFGNKETHNIKNHEVREMLDLILKWKKRKVDAGQQYSILLNTASSFRMGLESTPEGQKIVEVVDSQVRITSAAGRAVVTALREAVNLEDRYKRNTLNNPAYG